MNLSIKQMCFGSAVTLMVFAAAFSLYIAPVHANPPSFIRNNTSSATVTSSSFATSTVTWQTAGNATSTYVLNGSLGNLFGVDTAALKLLRRAGATTSQTAVRIEYASNCDAVSPDWYSPATSTASSQLAFPTGSFSTTNAPNFIWNFTASSTVGSSGVQSPFDAIIIPVPMIEKCVRAVVSVPIGAASSSIYGEWVGKKQNQ